MYCSTKSKYVWIPQYKMVKMCSKLQPKKGGEIDFFSQFSTNIVYPYTAERRDVLGNTSPEARAISRGRGFCTPRPERLSEGNLKGGKWMFIDPNALKSMSVYAKGSGTFDGTQFPSFFRLWQLVF